MFFGSVNISHSIEESKKAFRIRKTRLKLPSMVYCARRDRKEFAVYCAVYQLIKIVARGVIFSQRSLLPCTRQAIDKERNMEGMRPALGKRRRGGSEWQASWGGALLGRWGKARERNSSEWLAE